MRVKILYKQRHTCNKGLSSGLCNKKKKLSSRSVQHQKTSLKVPLLSRRVKLRLLATGAAREKKKRWPLSGSSLSTALTVWITWEKRPPHENRLACCCKVPLSEITENVAGLNHRCQAGAYVHHLWEIYTEEMGALIFLKLPRRAASKWEEINLIFTDVRDSPHNVWPLLSAINRIKYIKCLFGRRLEAFWGWNVVLWLDLYSRFLDKMQYRFFFFLCITTAAI